MNLDEIGDILNDIVADDRRAGKVIHRLRSLFKKGECKKSSVDINGLIREVVALIHTEAMIRNVSIETILDRGLAPILGDKIQLQQVIINFILNASDAMKDMDSGPRKITITTSNADEKMVKVGVHDNGVGFG